MIVATLRKVTADPIVTIVAAKSNLDPSPTS